MHVRLNARSTFETYRKSFAETSLLNLRGMMRVKRLLTAREVQDRRQQFEVLAMVACSSTVVSFEI